MHQRSISYTMENWKWCGIPINISRRLPYHIALFFFIFHTLSLALRAHVLINIKSSNFIIPNVFQVLLFHLFCLYKWLSICIAYDTINAAGIFMKPIVSTECHKLQVKWAMHGSLNVLPYFWAESNRWNAFSVVLF